jgi:hypothetical protein
MALVADRDRDELLSALGAELHRRGSARIELCVIGGAALQAIGLVTRPTKDIDVVAMLQSERAGLRVVKACPLPDVVAAAAQAVAQEFMIDSSWLNAGPADLLDHGLPDGFESRLIGRNYGPDLTVHFASRLDQVCFKTYAAADLAGRHLTDLVALSATEDEILLALRWVARQDPSEGFHAQLLELLAYLGMGDVYDRL